MTTETEVQIKSTHELVYNTAKSIAETLGETDRAVLLRIRTVVLVLGEEQCLAFIDQAKEIEANGGMLTKKKDRRRTFGGVWFALAKAALPPRERWRISDTNKKKPKKSQQPTSEQPPQKSQQKQKSPQPSAFNWNDRIALITELAHEEKGSAPTVKITLVGRPGKVVDRKDFIVTLMESTKTPQLPKGLPTPTNITTKYAVYIAEKQWRKVAESIQNPEDVLIVEGFPKTDAEVTAIAVFATNVTTKHLQAAKRAAQ